MKAVPSPTERATTVRYCWPVLPTGGEIVERYYAGECVAIETRRDMRWDTRTLSVCQSFRCVRCDEAWSDGWVEMTWGDYFALPEFDAWPQGQTLTG